MNIEALGNIGDFVSGIAVLVTLVYLAMQIRTNTRALELASRERVATEYREVSDYYGNPPVARAMSAALRRYPDIDYDQIAYFHTAMNKESLFFQAVYARHESGQLEDDTYQAYLRWYSSLIATPGGSRWFDDVARPIYMPRMLRDVDETVESGNHPDAMMVPIHRIDPG